MAASGNRRDIRRGPVATGSLRKRSRQHHPSLARLMVRLTAAFFAAVLTLSAADDLDSQIKSLISVYASAEQNAADPVASEQAFYQGAIPGLLRVLDPHSVFFDPDRKSTRLNSSHLGISYAVFCL